MPRAALLLFLAALTLPGGSVPVPAEAQELAPGDGGSVVRRTTLVVNDMEASIAFYRDLLGFELWLEHIGVVTEQSLPSRAAIGAPTRLAVMKGRDPWIGMVGLLQYGDAQPGPQVRGTVVPGDVVLMLETDDVLGIRERMRAAGTPVLREPRMARVTGAGGRTWDATFLFAWDPDGHLLEINEPRRPVAASAPTRSGQCGEHVVERGYTPGRYGQIHWHRARPVSQPVHEPPLLLFHQTPLSGRMFSEVLPCLAQRREVYALDTPGYGESDPPPAPTDIAGYAAALGDFIGTLEGPVDLLGYHTGVLIAVELALTMPERVRALNLVAVPLLPEAQRTAYSPEPTRFEEDGSHLLEMWESSWRVRDPGQSVEQLARIVAEKQRAGSRAWWAGPAIFGYALEDRLPLLRQPVLMLRPRDGLYEHTARAADLIAHGVLVDREDWRYGFFDSAPAEVASLVLGFLDQLGMHPVSFHTDPQASADRNLPNR